MPYMKPEWTNKGINEPYTDFWWHEIDFDSPQMWASEQDWCRNRKAVEDSGYMDRAPEEDWCVTRAA